MNKTEAFNEKIKNAYRPERMSGASLKLSFLSAAPAKLTIREGDTTFASQFHVQLDEKPQVMFHLINGMSYQEEMNQKNLLKKLGKTELYFRKIENKQDEAAVAVSMERRKTGQQAMSELKKEILKDSTKEVNLLVQKNVREQLNTLTEKVYRKMERSLKDEHKRKGW